MKVRLYNSTMSHQSHIDFFFFFLAFSGANGRKHTSKNQVCCRFTFTVIKTPVQSKNSVHVHTWHVSLRHRRSLTQRDPSLDLMLAHYVTHSVSMINKCNISWIIQHNADCITPAIQARSLKNPQNFFSCRERISNLSLASHIREKKREILTTLSERHEKKSAQGDERLPESNRTQKWLCLFSK